MTGSHDHSVRLWDVRTAIPLATLEHHEAKVLAVGYMSDDTVVSGGADSLLHIYGTSKAEE